MAGKDGRDTAGREGRGGGTMDGGENKGWRGGELESIPLSFLPSFLRSFVLALGWRRSDFFFFFYPRDKDINSPIFSLLIQRYSKQIEGMQNPVQHPRSRSVQRDERSRQLEQVLRKVLDVRVLP